MTSRSTIIFSDSNHLVVVDIVMYPMFGATILLVLCNLALGCQREPSVYHSREAKTSGDNGYYIKLQDDIEKYAPGEVYTGYLLGSRTFNKVQHFRRFTLNIELNEDPGNISPQKVGTFQLFGDNLSKFNEDCVNTLSETSNLPKTEISFLWTAPPAGSGCVTFRAMVLEDPSRWFADDGRLSKIVCEQSENDRRLDPEDCCACDEAKYNLIFEGIWSKETHPKDFPFSLWLTHFSDVIGASHVRNFSFWGEGHIATEGFRSLAEWGSVRLMESELRSQSKYLRTIVKAAGLWYPKVNTNTSTNFRVDRKHHLVSLASMFGPSPDWVVGVNGLNLCQKDCTWIENLAVDLYPWDAGTDSGLTYMSPNAETKPKERMHRITTMYPEDPRAPFYDPTKKEIHPMARFYFTREKVIPKGCDETFLTAQLDVSENTEDTSRPECGVTDYTAWSSCSVSCGKGLRMRTREYLMPQKAEMFQCNRQLISKEMCVADVSECEGGQDSEEQIEKNEGVCAVTSWSPWTECSSSCGVGFITRSRHFLDKKGRKKCIHVNIFEREKCMGPPCLDDNLEVPDPMCPVTEWSDWGPCSATCGKGVKLRTRLLLVDSSLQEKCSSRVELVQQKPCMDVPDCTFDMATAKEVCMQTSEPGYCNRHYNRWYFEPNKLMCVPFVYSGCGGNRNNFLTAEECNDACKVVRDAVTGGFDNPPQTNFRSNRPPVDCMVTDWTDWSPCSTSCGPGISEKVRMVKRPAENGGKPCPQRLEKKRRCNVKPCR